MVQNLFTLLDIFQIIMGIEEEFDIEIDKEMYEQTREGDVLKVRKPEQWQKLTINYYFVTK